MDLLDPAGLNRWNQGGMRIDSPVACHLALEPQPLAIGRKQQLDRSGIETNAVIQTLDLVGGVDSGDCQHRRKNLGLGDRGGITREQRLNIEGLVRLDDEMHAVPGNVDAWNAFNNL